MHTIVLVFRKPYVSAFSIESIFNTIFDEIKDKTGIKKYELPYFTKGIKSVIANILSLTCFRDEVVHITGDTYYAILGAFFCKRVITIHDLSFLKRTGGIKRKLLKIFWITIPVSFSHKITVVSQSTKKVLLEEVTIDPGKIQVIYNFINPMYQPVVRTFNKNCPRILQIGADFNKNIVTLANALGGIICALVIIGQLSQEQKEALTLNEISYINKHSLTIEELHKEYLIADLLTFVSTVEGFGMPILEAQATGLAVITSNCSSMPEIAGEGAILVEALQPESIRQGIIEITNNDEKRKSVIAAGFENVKRFSKAKIVADYLQMYKDL